MAHEHVPAVDYNKFAGDTKSQIVHLTGMLLDISHEHPAYVQLNAARSALEQAYASLRASIVPAVSQQRR